MYRTRGSIGATRNRACQGLVGTRLGAGGDDEEVVADRTAVGERDRAGCRIYAIDLAVDERDSGGQRLPARPDQLVGLPLTEGTNSRPGWYRCTAS